MQTDYHDHSRHAATVRDAPAPPARRSTAGYWIVILLLAGLLLFSIFGNLGLLAALMFASDRASSTGRGSDEFPSFRESVSYGSGDVKVVRIPLDGIITRESTGGLFMPGPDRVEATLRQIRAARHDESVRAIIMEIDSPGGAITPTDEIYHALQNFRTSSEDRLVLVHVRDMAASGGYYIAMASDWIIAEPTAIVGSIGVIMQTLNWKELSDRIGIRGITITAGENKDMLNPFKEVDPGHLAILQKIADDMHARFTRIVQARLELRPDTLTQLADGRIFIADHAAAHGMIDQIGYWDDVMLKLEDLLEAPGNIRVVRYEQSYGFGDLLARLSMPATGRVMPDLQRMQHPRLMYLWTP